MSGVAEPIAGFEGTLGGPVVEGDNPLDEAGVFQPTSDVLPEDEFPQFASRGAAEYPIEGGPFSPVEGARYAGAVHADNSYTRLTKTVDLTSVTAADSPELQFQLSLNSEPGYDHLLIEARTAGDDNWTTLPDLNGGTSTDVPADCEQGFLLELHPFLERYLTGGNPCTNTGTSGAWNSFTGATDGWTQVSSRPLRLCRPAGRAVHHLRDRSRLRRGRRLRRRHSRGRGRQRRCRPTASKSRRAPGPSPARRRAARRRSPSGSSASTSSTSSPGPRPRTRCYWASAWSSSRPTRSAQRSSGRRWTG